MNTQDITKLLQERLPVSDGELPYVVRAAIEWKRKLGEDRGYGTLIIYTARPLTTDGGDGWNGFQGADLHAVHDAANDLLMDADSMGLFNEIVVRSHMLVRIDEVHTDGNDRAIDVLFE